ncbi:hypothetical protein FHR22_004020 [Sphingopyxis panaciterrae]|uniref:hypothetical protein n=1 Tax=Sphingopyxis panaciterrae TaxID=363841 RepID=UPI0014217D99|nr:hypothetical protein [Sphingopyxis panaciterrae]NIJ39273.1 hypothetical protein [Sphingopyxis panaciterrae]
MIRWSPAAPARPGCPHRRLFRLLAREMPHGMTLGVSTLRPWASANFVGARHLFPCSPAAGGIPISRQTLLDRLSAVEWRLAGHIVADIAVEPANGAEELRIEILTVED